MELCRTSLPELTQDMVVIALVVQPLAQACLPPEQAPKESRRAKPTVGTSLIRIVVVETAARVAPEAAARIKAAKMV